MTRHLPPDSIEYFVGSLWEHEPPQKIEFQLHCTADLNSREQVHDCLMLLISEFAAANLGRVAYVCYSTEFSLPWAGIGPLIIDHEGRATIPTTLDTKRIPAGHYFILTTRADATAPLRLETMRAAICAILGKAGAHHRFYEASIEFSTEPKLGIATPAFEVPRKGFWCALVDADRAKLAATAFIEGCKIASGQAAISILNAALDQRDLSAKHILYWSAMETLAGANRLANTLGKIYGCSPQHLDDYIPFTRLKRGRDDATHHGKRSDLSQEHERVLLGMFTDVLALSVTAKRTSFGPMLAKALAD